MYIYIYQLRCHRTQSLPQHKFLRNLIVKNFFKTPNIQSNTIQSKYNTIQYTQIFRPNILTFLWKHPVEISSFHQKQKWTVNFPEIRAGRIQKEQTPSSSTLSCSRSHSFFSLSLPHPGLPMKRDTQHNSARQSTLWQLVSYKVPGIERFLDPGIENFLDLLEPHLPATMFYRVWVGVDIWN